MCVAGDLLVTSGLGGGFPAGYPVGTVAEVKRDPAQSLADVDVRPAAALDRSRELMFVWLKPSARAGRDHRRHRGGLPPGSRANGRRQAPRPRPAAKDCCPPPERANHDARRSYPPHADGAVRAGGARARGDPVAGGARSLAPRLPGAGGLLLVDRVAARRRPDARLLLRARARCDQRRGARPACAGTHPDGGLGHASAAAAAGVLGAVAIPDHLHAAHAVSVHLVLGRRRHRQSRGELSAAGSRPWSARRSGRFCRPC